MPNITNEAPRTKDVLPRLRDRLRVAPLLLSAIVEDGLMAVNDIPVEQRPPNESREKVISFVLEHAEPSTQEAAIFVDDLRRSRGLHANQVDGRE